MIDVLWVSQGSHTVTAEFVPVGLEKLACVIMDCTTQHNTTCAAFCTYYCTISLPTLPYVLALRASDLPCTWCVAWSSDHLMEHEHVCTREVLDATVCMTNSTRRLVDSAAGCSPRDGRYLSLQLQAHPVGLTASSWTCPTNPSQQ